MSDNLGFGMATVFFAPVIGIFLIILVLMFVLIFNVGRNYERDKDNKPKVQTLK